MSDTATSNALDVAAQAVRALTLYALSEFQSGNATTIVVSAEGTSFSVSDDGRGHAIDRTVAGSPYLPFIYTHLHYPFGRLEGGPVQLHGIGMSLLNALCSELSVTVRKKSETLSLSFRAGRLHEELHRDQATGATGNTVTGTVNSQLQSARTDAESIEQWLAGVLAANPGLRLNFNGKVLHAPPADDA